MDRARSPNDLESTRSDQSKKKERTSFASFKAFSHKLVATYALLRLTRSLDDAAGSSESADEYAEIASSSRWAFMSVSPRCSSSLKRRCLNSKRKQTDDDYTNTVCKNTHQQSTLPARPVGLLLPLIRCSSGGNTRSQPLPGRAFRDDHKGPDKLRISGS